MTHFSAEEAPCRAGNGSAGESRIRLRIEPREKNLGEFSVRRVLPASERRSIGPFVFFDHMGPATFPPGRGIDVRPHPHIGIATITYLFEGEILHRDSLGVVQPIRPGAVNLMTAGRGIVHSERPGADLDRESRLHGIQSWIALPDGQEEIDPAFTHYGAAELPQWQSDGATLRLIMGELQGRRSPVSCHSRTLYADLELRAGAALTLPQREAEQALYVASGRLTVAGAEVPAGVMVLIDDGGELALQAGEDTRALLIGGEPVGERQLYWNFVSSSAARIDAAADDWRGRRFPPVPGDDERIPLPGEE